MVSYSSCTVPLNFSVVVKVKPVSYEELEAMKEEYFEVKHPDGNPFHAKNIIDYNIGGLRTNQFGRVQIKHYLEFS